MNIGPCVGIEEELETNIGSYSTVFCAGNRCDESMFVGNDKVSICEAGENMPEPHLIDLSKSECTDVHYKCITDVNTNLNYWQRLECVNGKKFNRYSNDCSQECKY